jgi:hypothetical protein
MLNAERLQIRQAFIQFVLKRHATIHFFANAACYHSIANIEACYYSNTSNEACHCSNTSNETCCYSKASNEACHCSQCSQNEALYLPTVSFEAIGYSATTKGAGNQQFATHRGHTRASKRCTCTRRGRDESEEDHTCARVMPLYTSFVYMCVFINSRDSHTLWL